MNEFSDVCLQLAREVLRVCEDADIPCILSDECVHKMLKDSEQAVQPYLIVKADDFDALYERLKAVSAPQRAVESMKNNDWYPDFSMRYVDTTTTCYYDKVSFRYSSIGVFIVPLRRMLKGRSRLLYERLEHWDLGNGRKIYPKLLSLYKLHKENNGCIAGIKWKRSEYLVSELLGKPYLSADNFCFPTSTLDDRRKAFRYMFPAPIYFDTRRGSGNFEEAENAYLNKRSTWISLLKNIRTKALKRIWRQLYPITRDWNRINCVNDRDLLAAKYASKKKLILELYKNKDMERLKKELRPYHKKLLYYEKVCRLTIVFDAEIFEIYKAVYAKQKGRRYIKKISKRVPTVWRNK